MNYSSKNTISQQKADGPSDFLGITQSSGLDRHCIYARQRADVFKGGEVVSTQSARQYRTPPTSSANPPYMGSLNSAAIKKEFQHCVPAAETMEAAARISRLRQYGKHLNSFAV